jgi:hypothetical protein
LFDALVRSDQPLLLAAVVLAFVASGFGRMLGGGGLMAVFVAVVLRDLLLQTLLMRRLLPPMQATLAGASGAERSNRRNATPRSGRVQAVAGVLSWKGERATRAVMPSCSRQAARGRSQPSSQRWASSGAQIRPSSSP